MKNLGYSFLLILAAFIWGSTFVAQVEGNDAGPFVFVCIRNWIATAGLFLLAKILDFFGKSPRRPKSRAEQAQLWKAGIACGIALFFAMNLQQFGIYLGTPAGKSGFLTTCYIIFVPILGIFLGKKSSPKLWFCVALTLAGLYLLCIRGTFSLELSDGISLLCALGFASQIHLVDKFGSCLDNVRLSAIQFLVVAILSTIPMFFIDMGASLSGIQKALAVYSEPAPWLPLLYAAILSSGAAFTLQIVAQNKIRPTVASLLMSLESVFAVLSGWLVLGERLTLQEGFGCVLMFTAVILAQLGNSNHPQKSNFTLG